MAELQSRVEEWLTALRLLCDNPHHAYCVYEDFVRDKLSAEAGRKLWRNWNIMEFTDYRDKKWVEKLLEHAEYDNFVILGNAFCLPEILYEHVRRMRSVRWILPGEQYTQELQDFLEDFYEETGLAVELQLAAEDEPFWRVRPASAAPVNILDFSGEEKLSAADVAEGSVWLDMDSKEGQNRRMEARNPGIRYFSMKKEWKHRQKASIHLDTTDKSRYNT